MVTVYIYNALGQNFANSELCLIGGQSPTKSKICQKKRPCSSNSMTTSSGHKRKALIYVGKLFNIIKVHQHKNQPKECSLGPQGGPSKCGEVFRPYIKRSLI